MIKEPVQNQGDWPAIEHEPTSDERNAMRAYLQRTEVRLSTLHRIAVAFIGGAGLLLLFPIFFKDEFAALLRLFIAFVVDQLPLLTGDTQLLGGLMLGALLYPFILSTMIPLYALYIVLKDVIHFYYTIYAPGFPGSLFTPSFALSGITFSPDEGPEVKKRIWRYQYNPHFVNFMIPFSAEKREQYFDETIENTNGEILPSSRQWHRLEEMGIFDEQIDRRSVEHFNTALGLSRTLDRRLIEEVATTEASLVRHVLYLRRLVLRYVKTLLMFIWTTVVSFAMLPFLQEEKLPTFLLMAVGYTIWSIFVLAIMGLPANWIYRHRKGRIEQNHLDRQLTMLERHLRPLCLLAIVVSIFGVLLAALFYR